MMIKAIAGNKILKIPRKKLKILKKKKKVHLFETGERSLFNFIPSESVSCSVLSNSLQPHGLQPTRLYCPWNFPSKNTGMGSHFLLKGIFPTQA